MGKVKLKAQPGCYRRHLSCAARTGEGRLTKGLQRALCISFNDNEGHPLELKGHFCPRKVQDIEGIWLDGWGACVRSVERNRAAVQNTTGGEPPV